MAEKTFDIDAFIAQSKAARAQALVKKEAAERAAKAKKADSSAARNISNQANNKFQYAENLGTTLKDFEGQLMVFGSKIARGDKLTTIEQRDFDRVVSEYRKLSTTYNKVLSEGNAILAKMPETFTKEKKEIQENAGIKEEPVAAEAAPVSLTDFLKSAVGNVEKIKKLQQALKNAGTYTGPVNGVLNADVLLPAAERAEEKLDRYASLGITFADRFEGYSRLASTKGGDGLGTGGPSVTQYPSISSETDALGTINAVFNAELGRDATPSEIKTLTPKLLAEQRKNPSTQTVRTVGGKKIVETVTGLDSKQFLVTEIQKNPATKAEIDMRLKSAQSLNRQDLEKTAIANGLDLNKNFGTVVDTWVKRVDNGEDIDIFKNLIRNTAKIGLPDKVAGLLDNGVDLSTVYSPYKRLMASTLEIDPESISLDDATLRMAIGPDKEMSLYDFKRSLRKDPRWQYTDQARESVSEAALGVLRDFGFMG
jgi:archaellum component FlaC